MQWAVFSSGSLGDVAEELKVVSLPYVFRSSTHMFSVVDGEIGGQLSDALAGANMVVLSWFDGGARSFYTVEKPIRTPADIVGLKIRVPNAEVFIATAEALGANATPLAFAEVYTALQTGVVDGAENNAPSLVSTRHHEVVNYYSLDEHLMVPEALVLSKTVWDGLSEEDRAVFMGAAREAADLQRSLWTDRTDASMAAAREQGVEIIEIADKEPFVDAMVPVYEKLVTSNSVRELLAAIQAVE
jgi:tripartite ATP-independent transporter DctP family solute receptor